MEGKVPVKCVCEPSTGVSKPGPKALDLLASYFGIGFTAKGDLLIWLPLNNTPIVKGSVQV
jgi:hypothetical protein